MYASMGLGDSQFILVSIVVIFLAAVIVLVTLKRVPRSSRIQQDNTKFVCKKCGTELTTVDSFCTNCGAQMQV